MSKPDLIGTAEAAAILGIDPSGVRRYCQRGLIAGAVKLGRDWFAPRANVVRFTPPKPGRPKS